MAKYPAVDSANKFGKAVVAGKISACRYIKQACQRHLDDLVASKCKSYPYQFDAKEAQKKIALIELLPHTKGEWGFKRQLITLEPWQRFDLACTFDWKRKKDGLRRFRESYWEVNLKNGKSVVAAGVGLAPRFVRAPPRKSRRGRCSGPLA